ncbi:MAG: hypothetical protein J7L46_03730, partial [Bacteroidales bacterium]|nr:hypothetical protein [Bacteroidales bacterium]
PKKKSDGKRLLIALIILLFLGNLVLGWLYYQENQESHTVYVKLKDTSAEKEYIQKQLDDMSEGYDALKTKNDTLNQKIEDQKARIQQIKEDLKHNKNVSYYQINQYKKELETMRRIMKSYIVQIDSLNTLNQNLITENTQVKSSYNNEKNKNQELSQQNEDLSEKVDVAKEIRVFNLKVLGLNKKGKVNTKAKKIKKIQVCFVLGENKVVSSGTKVVYLRIARPDGSIISSSEYDLFDYQGNKIVYTDRREVEYNNEDTDVCVYWVNKSGEELISGTYYADIFVGGKNIGTTTLQLK